MSFGNYDDQNSTVRWVPRWARSLLGLEATYERPRYSSYDADRRRMAEGGVSWVPGPIRSWLGLDFTEPRRYAPDEYDDAYEAPAPRAAFRPAAPPSARPAGATYSRETSYTPPLAGTGSMADTAARRASAYGPPPPPAPRVAGQRPPVASGADLPPTNLEGYVQPVGHLLRSYARGALPPQGLEQFTREVRATGTDVYNLYNYWLRFQSEELFRLGRELLDIVADRDPAAPPASASSGAPTVRRIRVTTANGNGEHGAVATAPTTTPAPPPAPPATVASFSPTVTADDAAIPPTGGNPEVAFEARVAESRAEVRADIAAEGAPTVESIAEAARSAAEDAGDNKN